MEIQVNTGAHVGGHDRLAQHAVKQGLSVHGAAGVVLRTKEGRGLR